jgi:hypothetical protein
MFNYASGEFACRRTALLSADASARWKDQSRKKIAREKMLVNESDRSA